MDDMDTDDISISITRDDDYEQNSSEDEDGGLDWTKLPLNVPRPVIPKRGEKDFEPAHGGGSGLQRHTLDRARSAIKSISYAVWYPNLARAHVTVSRGVHFTSMGHSAQRPNLNSGKPQKRLELLPEEALYLVEKGALFCWKASHDVPSEDVDWDSASQGAPMSAQQAYAEMIGKQDLTLDRYHTFSYLRRLGYIVTRARPPSPSYPIPAPASLVFRLLATLLSPICGFLNWLVRPSTSWWRPLVHRRWLHHNLDYPSTFKTLRFFPSGHSVPLWSRTRGSPEDDPSPYEVFYHLYKPNAPYRKTAPPPPDFSVVVVNARTTPMPTIAELTHIYEGLPVTPPPLPLKRTPPSATNRSTSKLPAENDARRRPFFLARLLSYFPFCSEPPPLEPKPVRVNPFMAIRQGNKTVIVAAVDAGVVSFFRFGQGAFEEWPMT
ncbi:tRNA-splicing endonuclease subunit sen54 N-term-domain-containing protein [Multifurca ochricompacta]|uniref:tRNA-splicing endonuclease subunit sen54 N-term-domain-containing protein n=1 Tax=Multifurca ochricompacta TaxID=376703 RepID=A0AAD4M9L4_9AGAM|nr:tRNA-splicing endonuclease subunit sen54 N-term-domain-containing protein [Multifurca ochricompacta]